MYACEQEGGLFQIWHCVPLYVEMPLMRLMPVLPRVRTISLRLGSCCVAGEFDVPLRMFYPDGSSPSFRLKIIAQGKV